MNNRRNNGLGDVIRQVVQYGVDSLNRALNRILNKKIPGQYQDPDIIDMPQPPAIYEHKPGVKIAGILMAVAGFGFGGISLFWSLIMLIGAAFIGEFAFGLGLFGANLLLVGGCGFLGVKGLSMIGSVNRFSTYVKTIGQEELCNIKQLADRIGKSQNFVVKDVEKMIQKGWFCQGHLDKQKTCLMVTDDMYREYKRIENEKEQHRLEEEERRRQAQMEAEREREEMEKAERARKKSLWNTGKMDQAMDGVGENDDSVGSGSRGGLFRAGKRGTAKDLYGKNGQNTWSSSANAAKDAERAAELAKLPPEVRKVIEQGDAYVNKIRECNDAIPGEVISAKIDHMELLVDRIFDRVEQKPEMVGDIRKMMEYYLPTTIKLLETYAEMDAQPVGGENIQSTKKEIEESLDTINVAFEKLLDSLFQDTAWDVSSDISVLKTMLAQEGLNDDGLKK